MRRLLALAFVLLSVSPLVAQERAPLLQARSKVVTIIDGQHEKRDYWYIMPERSPEVYYAELPRVPHRVTFVTDLDSISFDVTYGSRHAFVIQLADGTLAPTEIRAEYRQLLPYRRVSTEASDGPDLIPFTLGDNDKIYVTGSINGSPALALQVDLGAGGNLIKKASVSKVTLTFDESLTLRNSDGEHVVPASSRNTIAIAGLQWEDVPIAVADNMTHREDGIVGNALFQDRVVTIDYDRMVLAIHDTLPDVSGWQRAEMILDGVVPFIRGDLEVGGLRQSGWFMLDTGAYTSILRHERLSKTSKFGNELRRLLGPLGGNVRGPVVSFANQTFSEINFAVAPYEGRPSELGVLGNDVLKRLNILVDNRLGSAYVRPNRRAGDAFRNPERLVARTVAIVALVVAGAVTYRRLH